MAPADKVVAAVLMGAHNDLAVPVVAEAEGHYLVAAVREKAEVAAAHSAAEVGDVFSANK